MNDTSTVDTYSAFWPLQFLVVCLGCWIAYQLYGTCENYRAIDNEITQLTPRGAEAIEARKQFLTLAGDIQQLALGGDATAAQILSELKTHQPSTELPESPAQTK